MKIVTSKTKPVLIPLQPTKEDLNYVQIGGCIYDSKGVKQNPNTSGYLHTYSFLNDLLRGRLYHYGSEVEKVVEDREPTLSELGELAILYVYHVNNSKPGNDRSQLPPQSLISKYPDLSYQDFFSMVQNIINKQGAEQKDI